MLLRTTDMQERIHHDILLQQAREVMHHAKHHAKVIPAPLKDYCSSRMTIESGGSPVQVTNCVQTHTMQRLSGCSEPEVSTHSSIRSEINMTDAVAHTLRPSLLPLLYVSRALHSPGSAQSLRYPGRLLRGVLQQLLRAPWQPARGHVKMRAVRRPG